MLTFGEILNVLLKQHNLKAKEVAEKIGVSESYFSRLKKGLIMPQNYELIQNIAEAVNLPEHEKRMLINAYKVTKLGDDILSTEEAIQNLYKISFPKKITCENSAVVGLGNGDTISGVENIVSILNSMFSHSTHMDCLFIPENKQFCDLFREKVSVKSSVSWLVYLDDTADKQATNINIFTETMSFLLTFQADVRYRYKNVNEYYCTTAFPYVFINGKELVLVERDCQTAFYFDNQDFIRITREKFEEQMKVAAPFVLMLTGFEEYLENWETLFANPEKPNSDDLLIIEKRPCIIHEATHSDISLHISDNKHNDLLARTYLDFLKWSATRLRTQEMMFSVDGIREYFSAEMYHEYSRHLTKPISKALRREFFVKLIEMSKRKKFLVPEVMLDLPFGQSDIRVINVWKSGIVLIVFDFDEAFRIAVMQEKTISSSLWDYFHSLKDCGIVRDKKESIQIMEDELRKEIDNNKGVLK